MRVIIKRAFITALISVVFSQVALTSVANAEGYTSSILAITGSSPINIIMDSAGNIYTANYGSNNVSKITPDGISSILGTTGVAPFGIIMDSAGNIYTSNVNSDNVSKLTAAAPAPVYVRQSSNLTFAQSLYASDTLSDPDGQLRATVDQIMNKYDSLIN